MSSLKSFAVFSCFLLILVLQRIATAQQSTAPFDTALHLLESGKAPPQHSILIFQDGKMLLERYWDGPDLVYGRPKDRKFGPDDLHDLRSCSKSAVSLLVGIAIEEGLLPSVDTPAYKLFPDLKLDDKMSFTDLHRKISVSHLLNMTAGLEWQQYKSDDHVNNEAKLEGSRDAAAYVWAQPMSTKPGEKFNYNSGLTGLLGRAIKRRSGKSLEQYAKQKLFEPLGITKWEWLSDSDGDTAAHFGLRLTPPDMLKIGQLVLRQGEWEGQQLVPKSWIQDTSDHKDGSRRYRNQWWLESFKVNDRIFRVVAAHGKGGQRILVVPELNAVVVGTAGHYEDNRLVDKSNEFFDEHVLPKLRKDD